MYNLTEIVSDKNIPSGELVLYWLGGASFIIKNSKIAIGLDLYLSDSCRNEKGEFKRIMPEFIEANALKLDYLIATHDHGDHFDYGAVKELINENNNTKLIGPNSVLKAAKKLGIEDLKFIKLNRGETVKIDDVIFTAVLADHGSYSPDCIGMVIKINEINIYYTSDSCYKPDLLDSLSLKDKIDILIVPINGKFGNPDARDASYITYLVNPKFVIPCHYWMFKEHGGDPGEFNTYCTDIVPDIKIMIPAIGEGLIFK